jgi:hypothetical protein
MKKRVHRRSNFLRVTFTEYVIISILGAAGIAGLFLSYGPQILKALLSTV